MEQERFIVIDNKKGVLIPLSAEREEIRAAVDTQLDDKVNRLYALIKGMVKQTIIDTVKEYNFYLKEEIKEYEKQEISRWDELLRREEEKWKELITYETKHWELLEMREKEYREKMKKEDEKRWRQMEEHFETVDKRIREKQKRKKGP